MEPPIMFNTIHSAVIKSAGSDFKSENNPYRLFTLEFIYLAKE
jgi:hypothetical protein